MIACGQPWNDADGCMQQSLKRLLPVLHMLLWFWCADGIIPVKRAVYKCNRCQQHVGQAPLDYLGVGAWPSSLNSSHMKTIVDQKLLQMWDSHWLHNPQASLSGFLKGVAHAACQMHNTQVSC